MANHSSFSLPIVTAGRRREEPAILGIDLGTTFSLAAVMTDGGPVMVRDASGDARIPSVIGFAPDGTVRVGKAAREKALADPAHTVYSVKRLIGRAMSDLKKELEDVPYQVIERETSEGRKVLCVRVGGVEKTPEELSATILREVVARAEATLGRRFEKAVITVPAYFDESQRQATRDAGRLAGLDVVRIINEPTAASLAYGLGDKKEGTIAVYDFGGGTFDCSILTIADGVFKVLSTRGDTLLGGDDIDRALMLAAERDSLQNPTPSEGHCPVIHDPFVRQALRDACEKVKIELTTKESAELVVALPDRGVAIRRATSRKQFESLASTFVERTIECCRLALRDANLEPAEIDEVVLVGGSSRIPLVRRRVEEFFGRRPHCELNPDEVVAMGAAVQGHVLAGLNRHILLLDITPLSLGIETMGGTVSRLIARNSTIPAQATERFTTFVDNQTGVDIHVVQGERELVKDCRSLGRFRLTGIPPMPAGMPRVDVTFLIDANGMLQVTARENKSGVEAGIEVLPSHGLAREEVERMIRESVSQARADFDARRLIDLRAKAEANVRHTLKGLANPAAVGLSADQRHAIEHTMASVVATKENEDVEALKQAVDAFDAATLPLATLLMNKVVQSEFEGRNIDEI